MLFKKKENKYLKRLKKDIINYTKHLSDEEYEEVSDYPHIMACNVDDKIIVLDSLQAQQEWILDFHIDFMKSVGFRRTGLWTTMLTLCFFKEVLDTYINEYSEEEIKQRLEEIAFRYGIRENAVSSYMAQHLKRIDDNKDIYEISNWFSRKDILKYKYRNPEKLQKDVDENKISESDLKIIRDMFGV